LPNLDWSDQEVRAYEIFLQGFPIANDFKLPHHRIFGHPNQLQDDMHLQSVLYANGVFSLDDPHAPALTREKESWLLLLQVDSDDHTGMKWSSSGMLYFWIETTALRE
jgi:uncharacterized protein YwqG